MCTNPPSRSTQAPNFSVSIGQVGCGGDFPGGHGAPPFPGGFVTGGFPVIGGTVKGGFTIGGTVMGGKVIGGTVPGGFTIGGTGRGPFGFLVGLCFFGGFPFPQWPQPRMGVKEEMKSMQMKKKA